MARMGQGGEELVVNFGRFGCFLSGSLVGWWGKGGRVPVKARDIARLGRDWPQVTLKDEYSSSGFGLVDFERGKRYQILKMSSQVIFCCPKPGI